MLPPEPAHPARSAQLAGGGKMVRMLLALAVCASALQGPAFELLHVSDVHVDARPAGSEAPKSVRGEETFDWLGQILSAAPADARPEFVLATGDITEFGAPGDTWRDVERLFAKLEVPWYPVPGNHDQTWNPIDAPYFARLDVLGERIRARRSYVVKRDGWALLALNSASLYEPRPSFDPRELEELEHQLGRHAWGVPVLVAMHHPPDSAEFAQPHASRTLFSALDGLDVELVLYGHGHSVKHHRVFGVDCVQGGSTFASKGRDERGFGRVTFRGGRLGYSYRYLDPARPETVVLESESRPDAVPRSGLSLRVEVAMETKPALLVAEWMPPRDDLGPDRAPWRVLVDGRVLEGAAWSSAPCEDCDRYELPLAALGLGEGLRLVTLEIDEPDGRRRQKSIAVDAEWAHSPPARSSKTPMYADPGFVPHRIYPHWFGAWRRDDLEWRIEPLFRGNIPGRPLRVGDVVYLGDRDGRLHAVALGEGSSGSTQRFLWSTPAIGMAIESAPALAGELLIVGAWDGNVHAFDAKNGERKWTAPGPKSSEGGAARYYAPADCSPVVLQDRIYVCDRGYMLAWYSSTGDMHVLPHANVAAIGASADGANLYLRGTDDVLARIDRDGALVWSARVPLGRAPVPPLEKDGVVHVVSDQGLWSRVDARTGAVLGTLPTSATAYVFAPPILGDDGSVEIRSQAGTRFLWTPERARPASPEPTGPR